MIFDRLLTLLKNEPVFSSGMLAVCDESKAYTQLQLSRWVKEGKVIQLRRGLYVLGDTYRKVEPHPFMLANQILQPSYISLQSALSFYELIPEYVPTLTSVTSRRPGSYDNPFGSFTYRTISQKRFFGYRSIELAPNISAFVAEPEKALLDTLYFTEHSDNAALLEELRLQHLEAISWARIVELADNFSCAKVHRCLKLLRPKFLGLKK